MNGRWLEGAAVAVGVVYLTLIVVAMNSLSFDIWGALLLTPIYGVLGFALINTMFPGPLAAVRKALYWGLGLKLVGAAARYWVGFEAYEGGIDAAEYHRLAREEAGEIWSGERPVFDAIPSGTGTEFTEQVTAFLYTVTGGSQLAGFVTFSFLAFVGVAYFVRAALTALPDMAARKYAWLCAVAPSLVYWPSSIGKEALVMFGLGVGTYGIANLLGRGARVRGVTYLVIGLGFAALIRPHMAGIWVGGAVAGLMLAAVVGVRGPGGRGGRIGVVLALVFAAGAFGLIAQFTLEFLNSSRFGDEDASLAGILQETTRRTSQAGSAFTPPSITSPLNWPYAIVRTLTRPLPTEARGVAQFGSAAELTAIAVIFATSWQRVRTLPKALFKRPYVMFAIVTLALASLAYTSLANLGVLTRQKSLLFPLLLLIPCLPTRGRLPLPSSSAPTNAQQSTPNRERGPVSVATAPRIDADDFWSDSSRLTHRTSPGERPRFGA